MFLSLLRGGYTEDVPDSGRSRESCVRASLGVCTASQGMRAAALSTPGTLDLPLLPPQEGVALQKPETEALACSARDS